MQHFLRHHAADQLVDFCVGVVDNVVEGHEVAINLNRSPFQIHNHLELELGILSSIEVPKLVRGLTASN